MGQKLDEKKMLTVLDELYSKALDGVPKVSKPIEELAKDYLGKNSSPEIAAKELKRGSSFIIRKIWQFPSAWRRRNCWKYSSGVRMMSGVRRKKTKSHRNYSGTY